LGTGRGCKDLSKATGTLDQGVCISLPSHT
jgi:hypothetical protein